MAIQAGSSGVVPVAGSGTGPSGGRQWFVYYAPGFTNQVADNLTPNGWAVTPDSTTAPTQCTVGVPSGAVAQGYNVRYLVGAGPGFKPRYDGAFTVTAALAVPGAPTGCAATPAHVD